LQSMQRKRLGLFSYIFLGKQRKKPVIDVEVAESVVVVEEADGLQKNNLIFKKTL
jgi:hypothetical protein